MPKVIVPMRPFGLAAERFDLSPLAQYGAIHFLFDESRAPCLQPTRSLEKMVKNFDRVKFDPENDYVCYFSPDSFASFALGMILADYSDEMRLLRYDRPVQADGTKAQRGVYVPTKLECWPLGTVCSSEEMEG